MIVGPHIGTSIWNLQTDHYNHDQLADNWLKMEFHDHSPGRGVPIPTEGIADGAVTAAKLAPGANSIQDGSITPPKFATLPASKVYNSAVTSCANGTETTLPFDSERFDTNNLHDTVTNTSRFTIQTAGIYMVTASIQVNISMTTATTGVVRLGVYKNGVAEANLLSRSAVGFNASSHTLSTFARLAVGDFIQARVLNTTGASIDVSAGSVTAEGFNDFGLVWIAA